MLLTLLMLTISASEGLTFQVDPTVFQQATPSQTLELTLNGQPTPFNTLAHRSILNGSVWIGQGFDKPDLAVIGLKDGTKVFGMVRINGANWQIIGEAGFAMDAVKLSELSDWQLRGAEMAQQLSDSAIQQLKNSVAPNRAPKSRVDVLLTYNEVLLGTLARNDVEFALRVNTAFANFILENSQIPLILHVFGFMLLDCSQKPTACTQNIRPFSLRLKSVSCSAVKVLGLIVSLVIFGTLRLVNARQNQAPNRGASFRRRLSEDPASDVANPFFVRGF